MHWSEAFLITFSATAINHLGLVAAVEQAIRHPLPIVDCPKCLSFWSVLAYGLIFSENEGPAAVAVIALAFFCAYLSKWLHIAMFAIDTLYNKIYDTLYSTANPNTDGAHNPDKPMSDVP